MSARGISASRTTERAVGRRAVGPFLGLLALLVVWERVHCHAFSALSKAEEHELRKELRELKEEEAQLQKIMKTLAWPKLTCFQAFGKTYNLPLRDRTASKSPTTAELGYLGGFFDGDGCVSPRTNLSGCQLKISQVAVNAKVLILFRRFFGGGICIHSQGIGIKQPVLRWSISGEKARAAARQLCKVCLSKTEQLQLASNWACDKDERQLVADKLHELKRCPPNIPKQSRSSWAHLAGLLDSDGCILLDPSHMSLSLRISQKYEALLVRSKTFLNSKLGTPIAKVYALRASYVLQVAGKKAVQVVLNKLLNAGLTVKSRTAKCALSLREDNDASIREQISSATTGNQGRYTRLDAEGCKRSKRIHRLQTEKRQAQRRNDSDLVAQLERDVAGLQLHHKIENVKTSILRRTEDIQKLLFEGFTPLHHAAEFGLEKVLQRLLMARADVERRTREGLTATFIAAQEGRLQTVHLLLEAKAQLNAPKALTVPPAPAPLSPAPTAPAAPAAAAAVGRGQPAKAEVAKTQMPEGCTPLYAAAACNHLDVVKYLLAAGAEKEARSTASPLYIAAYKGHTAIVKSLLAARASLAPRSASTEGSTTLSPLLAAVEMAHLDTLQVLLDAKANLAKEGMTALMAAIRHDNGQVVQKLLQAGVPKDKLDAGWAPMHMAANYNATQVLKVLLAQRAQLELAGGNGATPLYVAAKNGHKEVLSALLEVRADPQKVRKDGWTPLQVACSQGHVEVVQQLLQAGVDKNKAKENGTTPLFLACSQGHLEVVQCLLEARADKDKASERRGAPLHVAAANCHVKVINCLLEARAKVNETRQDGCTPLFLAARSGSPQAVTFLLNALADQERCQEDGLRPLQIAAAGGHVETSRILLGFQQYPRGDSSNPDSDPGLEGPDDQVRSWRNAMSLPSAPPRSASKPRRRTRCAP
ncbi:Ankyrin-1 (ANK-1) (Ankyrin-R) (Erythrocyte ankyrin) [Durusdinium trenchii]|uniref:Ankyrin-1 (ANK-1) (Ankyrin-R) (Erythrocyte ankyrin) n=1 Tax=Durusdinium trenchii TaxID=1381693 RepID=A0ABP0RKX0_9DINO